MPKKIAFYLLLLTLVPFSASAAGLGKIKVKSGLGEPLDAEIEVLETSGDEALPLKAAVGSADDYASSGLADSYIPQGIRIQIIRHADNSRVLHLVSDRAVNEPFLELLVKAESSNTNIVRQYTVLLDPPVSRFSDEAEKSKQASPARQSVKANAAPASLDTPDEAIPEFIPRKSRKSAKHKKQVAAAREAVTSTRSPENVDINAETYTTQSGDVFGKVAQRYQPQGVSLKKVMAAFFAANPEAFVDGDINHLKAGQTLRIPTQDTMRVGSVQAKQGEPKKSEKFLTSTESNPQPVKETSPKFVLKVSPGDTDASSTEKPATEQPATEQPAPANAMPAAANSGALPAGTGNQPATVEPAHVEQDPPVDTTVPVAENGADVNPVAATPQPETASTAVEKPLSAQVSVENKSILDAFLTNLPWIAFGMAIPLLGFLVMYVLHRRRLADVQSLQDYPYDEDDIADDLVAENNLGEMLGDEPSGTHVKRTSSESASLHDAGVAQPAANVAQLFQPTQVRHDVEMDIHEVDPLVEAEIYMSYGRDEQAENILRNALVKAPQKHELSLGLLKIYADRSDTQAFERVARTVYEAAEQGDQNDVVIWGKAAILGQKIDPLNSLYQIEGVTLDSTSLDSQSEGELPTSEAMIEEIPSVENLAQSHVEPLNEELPELPPLEIGEMPAAEPLAFPDLQLPEDLDALKMEQQTAKVKIADKSNVVEFTLDDFMRPTLDEVVEIKGSSLNAELVQEDALFPAQNKKNMPSKK